MTTPMLGKLAGMLLVFRNRCSGVGSMDLFGSRALIEHNMEILCSTRCYPWTYADEEPGR